MKRAMLYPRLIDEARDAVSPADFVGDIFQGDP